MRFEIFGIHEKIYKWIALASVLGVSITSFLYYLQLKDKSDTFLIAISYALFLFIIGIYMTNMSEVTRNLFYRRKEQYIVLKKLNSVFSAKSVHSCSDNDVISFIISHKVFTGRYEKQKGETKYIAQNGFKYKKKYLVLEDRFCEQHANILIDFNSRINEYIDLNKLNKKVKYIHLSQINIFIDDLQGWHTKYLELSPSQTNGFTEFSNQLIQDLEKSINELKRIKNKLIKMNIKYHQKINKEIKKIEKIYGNKLIDDIYKLDNISYGLSVLERLITDVGAKMLKFDSVEEIQVNCSQINIILNELGMKIDSCADILEFESLKNHSHDVC